MNRDNYSYCVVSPSTESLNIDRMRRCRRFLLVILGIVVAILIIALIIHVVHKRSKDRPLQNIETGASRSRMSLLKFFNAEDGLDIRWCDTSVTDPLADNDCQVIGVNVNQPSNNSNQLLVASRTAEEGTHFTDWLEMALTEKTANHAFHIRLRGQSSTKITLNALLDRKELVEQKLIIIEKNIVPPDGVSLVDAKEFVGDVNTIYPHISLSLGWTIDCCDAINTGAMKAMWDVVESTTQHISFPVRASILKESWTELKKLLNRDPERFSIIVWAKNGKTDWDGATPYDLLYSRNDCDKKSIYYNLSGPQMEEFRQLSITAGSLFNHFPHINYRDGLDITWAHAVNSQSDLKMNLDGDVMMLEADVLLHGQDTENQTDVPIMAHPPSIYSDLTLEHFLAQVIHTNKGIKLDFKSDDVLEPSMRILQNLKSKLKQPVWLNADIMSGPNVAVNDKHINATLFKQSVNKYFPQATLSLGWTTAWNATGENSVYSRQMVEDMHAFCQDITQPVTFPVRAVMVRKSWSDLTWLLSQSQSYSLTIWVGKTDQTDPDDLVYVRNIGQMDKIYYDLPTDLMSAFKQKVL